MISFSFDIDGLPLTPWLPRRDAQYLRIRSATALRCSSLIVRFWLPAALAAFFLPRPTAGGTFPSIASIAR